MNGNIISGVIGLIIGGAALSLTEYGPFGKNWFDDQINGPERHAAAQRVILYVDRVLEHDTYERAVGALRRLDQAVTRVPKELELKVEEVRREQRVAPRVHRECAPQRLACCQRLLADASRGRVC